MQDSEATIVIFGSTVTYRDDVLSAQTRADIVNSLQLAALATRDQTPSQQLDGIVDTLGQIGWTVQSHELTTVKELAFAVSEAEPATPPTISIDAFSVDPGTAAVRRVRSVLTLNESVFEQVRAQIVERLGSKALTTT